MFIYYSRGIRLLPIILLFVYPGESSSFPTKFMKSKAGEFILGYPQIIDCKLTPDGTYLALAHKSGIDFLYLDSNTVDKTINTETRPRNILFSPKYSKFAAITSDTTRRFTIYDWNTKTVFYESDGKFNLFLFSKFDDSLLVYNLQDQHAAIVDLTNMSQTNISFENIQQILEFNPENKTIVGVYGVEETYGGENSTRIDDMYLHVWNYLDSNVIDHIFLEGCYQKFVESVMGYWEIRRYNFLPPKYDVGELWALCYYSTKWASGYALELFDLTSGLREENIEDHVYLDFQTQIKQTLDSRYVIVSSAGEYSLIDLSAAKESGINYLAGPFTNATTMDYDANKTFLYILGEKITDNAIPFGIHEYDVSSQKIRSTIPIINQRLSQNNVDISFTNKIAFLTNQKTLNCYDLERSSVEQTIHDSVDTLPGNIVFSPSGNLLRSYGNMATIWNASNEILHTWQISPTDTKNNAVFNHNGKMIVTASGNQNAAGVDNLIRIWDAETFEMQREIRGHANSVWYAEFSPDDRRIVSASLDGTAKVWDAASGAMVCEFVGHATGVEYAAFMPDGGWVISVGRDRRAFLWNAETAEVERTFENIHLPAQLSPDGKYLFAGSEVWDVETGERIKTLDGVAQDYSCLTLSPDGTLLLTSEYEGFTKVWNVQEHILKPSGVWDYSVHE